MRTYKVTFRDERFHILAIETVNCMTVVTAVSEAAQIITDAHENGFRILCDSRHITVELARE